MNSEMVRNFEILGEYVHSEMMEICMDCLENNRTIDKDTVQAIKDMILKHIDNCVDNIIDNGEMNDYEDSLTNNNNNNN
jgi:hypothetical protein